MKALVTGSNGFIGKKLVKKLRENGFEAKEFPHPQKSVLDKKQLEKDIHGIDIVFHLAAVLDEDGKNLFEVNVQGTQNALEAASNARVQQFIFLGSAGVMGDIEGTADENTPLNPKTGYEKSKAQAEKIVLSYQEVLSVTIVRSAFVLGPNKYWKKIIEMIEKGFPMIGNGQNKWQMVYVDDLVDCLAFLAGKEEAFGETFIVAEKEPKTLREIVEFVRKKKGVKGELKTAPEWLAKPIAAIKMFLGKLSGKKVFLTPEIIDRITRERNYSTAKIEALGWKAKTTTLEALERTMEGLEGQ